MPRNADLIKRLLIKLSWYKMPSLIIVNADTRMNSDRKEEFWYKEAYLLTEPDEDNFLDLIKKDIIIIDVIPN